MGFIGKAAAHLAGGLLAVTLSCIAHDAAAQNLVLPAPPDEHYQRFHWSDVTPPILLGGLVGAVAGGVIGAQSQSGEAPMSVIGAVGGAAAGMVAVWIVASEMRDERQRKMPPVDLGVRVPNDGPAQLTFRTSF